MSAALYHLMVKNKNYEPALTRERNLPKQELEKAWDDAIRPSMILS